MTTRTTAQATQQQAWPDGPTDSPGPAAASNWPVAASTWPADEGRNLAFMDSAWPADGPAR
jgi:hypothetical protein